MKNTKTSNEKKIEKNTGIRRLIAAAKNSYNGFRFAFIRDEAIRQEFALIAVLIPVAIYFAESAIELVLLLSGLFTVLITELLNTAIEVTIDRISLEYHELSKAAKDIASAAVLLSLIYCSIVWVAVLLF